MTTPQITRLPSGLVVVSDFMPDAASVSLGLWFGVGTRHEAAPENGLSHLLEHMFFKGTRSRDARTLNQTIEAVGGSLNAYTAREQTAYQARVLPEDVPLALELLADILLNSRFDTDDLSREKDVISAEIGEAFDAPDDWVFDLFQMTAWPDQPLGRPVLGSIPSLRSLGRQSLLDYIAIHYRAGRCVLSAAGAIAHDELVVQAERLFATLADGAGPTAVPALYRGGTRLESREIEQQHLCYGLRGVGFTHPLFYAQTLFATALGGGTSSRLYHEIREERGLAYSVSSFAMPFADDGLLATYMATDPERADEAVSAMLAQIDSLCTNPGQSELNRARALTRAGLLMSLESTESRAERMATQWLTHGRLISIDETLAAVQNVTLGEMAAYAAWLRQHPATCTALGPGLVEIWS